MTTVLAPLDYYTLIKVSGNDAQAFLQNQLSNDIKLVTEAQSQLSSYSSAKGMMFANFRIFMRNGDHYLRLATDTAEQVTKRLRMFVLRDDVQLTVAEDLVLLGLAGPDSLSALAATELVAPTDIDAVTESNGTQVIRCLSAEGEDRFELISNQALQETLSELKADSKAYLAKQIHSGEALISQATYEQFVAQNLNLELINAVNFKKGCYPGQEYIARTQYRGQVRSRTYLISANADMPVGSHLVTPGKEDSIGTIINSARDGEQTIALAVIRNKSVEKQAFDLQTSPTTKLSTLTLPYSLEAEEA
jgi:hypothetical protein